MQRHWGSSDPASDAAVLFHPTTTAISSTVSLYWSHTNGSIYRSIAPTCAWLHGALLRRPRLSDVDVLAQIVHLAGGSHTASLSPANTAGHDTPEARDEWRETAEAGS